MKTESVTLIATVLSPALLAWIGVATQCHQQTLDRVDKHLEYLDRQQQEAFAAGGARFEHARTIAADLISETKAQKRIAFLSALAFAEEKQIPELLLPMLAISELDDPDADYLRQGLEQLRDDKYISQSLRDRVNEAVVALGRRAIPQLASESANASEPAEKQQAEKQLQKFANSLTSVAVSAKDPTVQQQARSTLAQLNPVVIKQAVSNVGANLSTEQKNSVPPRIYLQIANEDQRVPVRTIQNVLISKDYIVPGIQNVAGKGYIPDTLEVRYFDSGSKSKAEEILGIIKANGAKDGRVSYVIPTANDLRISSDIKSHFEVWAGRNSF